MLMMVACTNRPKVAEFITSLPNGSLVGDIGCGNGKNIPACNEVGPVTALPPLSLYRTECVLEDTDSSRACYCHSHIPGQDGLPSHSSPEGRVDTSSQYPLDKKILPFCSSSRMLTGIWSILMGLLHCIQQAWYWLRYKH